MAPNYRMKMGMEMGSMTKAAPCIICSGKNNNFKVHHIHYSTTWYNRQMSSKGVSHPMCHFCDVPHAIDNRTRLNVILTTSTLAGIQYMQGWGWEDQDPLHCDIEAIPGAKIVTLKRAWERAYHRNPLHIDTDTALSLLLDSTISVTLRGSTWGSTPSRRQPTRRLRTS